MNVNGTFYQESMLTVKIKTVGRDTPGALQFVNYISFKRRAEGATPYINIFFLLFI